jgi:hypothetical protein
MFIRSLSVLLILLSLAGCGSDAPRVAAGEEVFVGPKQLVLRAELTPRSEAVATLNHGERVQIVSRRRRFARVRSAKGAEGWVDGRLLMRPDQIEDLHRLWKAASGLPAMGSAAVYDKLNIHTQPSRGSPSFEQIPEQGRVEIVWEKIVPKNSYNDSGIDPPEQKKQPKPKPKQKKEKEKKSPAVPPPPPPPAPKVPDNWLDISKSALPEDLAPEPKADPEPEPPPIELEDWSLVRTKEGKAGWVLSRALNMAIPDQVAQYAEGKRITSYFPLGEVRDRDGVHNHWLWTTIAGKLKDYQFDSFRVFMWSERRHRYETSYIDRNVIGYFPVEVKMGEVPTFTLLVQNKEGALVKKTYAFQANRVRLISTAPGTRPDPLAGLQTPSRNQPVPIAPGPGFFQRLTDRFAQWRRGFLAR